MTEFEFAIHVGVVRDRAEVQRIFDDADNMNDRTLRNTLCSLCAAHEILRARGDETLAELNRLHELLKQAVLTIKKLAPFFVNNHLLNGLIERIEKEIL